MSFISVLRDGENMGEAVIQREMAYVLSDCPVVGGVGTGFSAGVVGKMNGAAGANPNHFSVQANGTNLVITIQPGFCWIVKDNGSSTYDPRVVYIIMNASTTLTLAGNSQGTSRTDTICLRFDQSIAPDAQGTNLPTIVQVQGGASNALGNAPADSALYLPLANIVIATGATSVNQSNVTDRRHVQPSQARASFGAASSTTTVATGATVTLNRDTILKDPSGSVTLGASSKFSCPLPGSYLVKNMFIFNSISTSGACTAEVTKNSSEISENRIQTTATASNPSPSTTCVVDGCVLGDSLIGQAFQNAVASVTTVANTAFDRMEVVWIGF